RQVVLQLQSQLIVHVDLDGDEQELAHSQDWNAFHLGGQFLRELPVRFSARASASARLALVVTPCRSTPRCTMVCAICGRTPEMMHSAPMSRSAVTVLSRCWATRVSTVGTPVMSRMAICAPVSTTLFSRVSMTTCVRAESSVPIIGIARMPSHSFTTGV